MIVSVQDEARLHGEDLRPPCAECGRPVADPLDLVHVACARTARADAMHALLSGPPPVPGRLPARGAARLLALIGEPLAVYPVAPNGKAAAGIDGGCAAALRQLRDRLTVQRSGLRPDGTAQVLGGINGQSIARRLTAAARAAGIEGQITGHSGRVGLAVELTRRGAPEQATAKAGGWKSSRMVAHSLQRRRSSRAGRRRYLPVGGAGSYPAATGRAGAATARPGRRRRRPIGPGGGRSTAGAARGRPAPPHAWRRNPIARHAKPLRRSLCGFTFRPPCAAPPPSNQRRNPNHREQPKNGPLRPSGSLRA